jgi:hypothetical protein
MSYSNYEQTIVVNGYALSGVTNIDGSYGISEKPIKVAGVGFIDALIEKPLEGNFSISRQMVGFDPLLETNILGKYSFDENNLSGVILYDNNRKGFGFKNGRINSYSISCSVGQIPEIQTDITVYGELGKNVMKTNSYELKSDHMSSFDGDFVFYTNSLGRVLDEATTNLQPKFIQKNISISETLYASLYDQSIVVEDGDVLGLGKDAFQGVSYELSDIIHKEHPDVQFTDQSKIKLKVSDFEIDAISDFSYSRSINLKPIYALPKGDNEDWNLTNEASYQNLEPIQIDVDYPIETNINFTMIADEYEVREVKDRIQSAPKSTVEIELRDSRNDTIINSFTGNNVRLIGETINSSIEGEMSISLSYKGYDTYHNPVS